MLLLLMSIATTTRFNLFLLSTGLRHAYTRYIQQNIFDIYNNAQKKQYDNPTSSSSGSGGGGGESKKQSTPLAEKKNTTTTTRINIHPLFADKTGQALPELEYAANVKTLLIRFIEISYSKQPPFKEYFAKVSVADFVNEMIETSKPPLCGQAIKAADDISSIPFRSPEARKYFYWMLTGGGIEKRYPSLISYLDWKLTRAPIYMYSASKPMLLAIYRNDQHQVDLFIHAREEINLQASQSDASDEFLQEKAKTWNALFNMEILTGFPPTFLDFSIPKPESGE